MVRLLWDRVVPKRPSAMSLACPVQGTSGVRGVEKGPGRPALGGRGVSANRNCQLRPSRILLRLQQFCDRRLLLRNRFPNRGKPASQEFSPTPCDLPFLRAWAWGGGL